MPVAAMPSTTTCLLFGDNGGAMRGSVEGHVMAAIHGAGQALIVMNGGRESVYHQGLLQGGSSSSSELRSLEISQNSFDPNLKLS